jgi:hypothetical protein
LLSVLMKFEVGEKEYSRDESIVILRALYT